MTLIPFYCTFLTKLQQTIVYEGLINSGSINVIKSLLGLKSLKCKVIDFKLKFCYQCWTENQYMYFDIEHQVKDNYICYKHKIRLQYININSSGYFSFDRFNISQYANNAYCIEHNDEFLQCLLINPEQMKKKPKKSEVDYNLPILKDII